MSVFANFQGGLSVVPALNSAEISYLQRFADSRRVRRVSGPYTTEPFDFFGSKDADVPDPNEPAEGQPDLECQWVPASSGKEIVWNHSSKFPLATQWLEYLIGRFLEPNAALSAELLSAAPGRYYAPEFEDFTFDHIVNGIIDVSSSSTGECWQIVVQNNRVTENWLAPGPS